MAQNMLLMLVGTALIRAKILQLTAYEWIEFMTIDNGGRRIEKDRRKFSYTTHIPERRVAKDRRSGRGRRKNLRLLSRTRDVLF